MGRTGCARAGPWAMDWGQAATGRLRGGPVSPSHSPARPAPQQRLPPLRSGLPGRRCPLAPPTAGRTSPPGRGTTGPEGPHLRINGPWPLPLPRVGTRRRSRPVRPATLDDRSAQRPARVPGPLFERSGEQATGPARIDPLEQTAQRPRRTQPPHHTRARQHEPSHHQSSRIDPFKSRGYTDN